MRDGQIYSEGRSVSARQSVGAQYYDRHSPDVKLHIGDDSMLVARRTDEQASSTVGSVCCVRYRTHVALTPAPLRSPPRNLAATSGHNLTMPSPCFGQTWLASGARRSTLTLR
jgi:hypothetical protein